MESARNHCNGCLCLCIGVSAWLGVALLLYVILVVAIVLGIFLS